MSAEPAAPADPAPAAPADPAPAGPAAPATTGPATGRPPRLRPGVAVTPLARGLHLRGREEAVTLEGSRALSALWELLAPRLAPHPGAAADAATGDAPPVAPQPERVEAALAVLTARLADHGLLVERSTDGGAGADWLGAVADHPDPAAEAIAATVAVIDAAEPAGPLATALVRALVAAGAAAPVRRAGGTLPPGAVLVTAAGVAVAAAADGRGGFVGPPVPPDGAAAVAQAIADRLRDADRPRADRPPAPDDGPVGPALAALLAGAAAQRLLCAVAGLPDPARPDEDPRLLPGRPAVLVAEARPPAAEHRPWAAGPPLPGHPQSAPPPEDLAEALRRVTALGDPRLGAVDAPLPRALPQLPVALVSCRTPAGTLLAGAVRTDLARLDAACRSAELHLAAGRPAGTGADRAAADDAGGDAAPVVGADAGHALGIALRRAALALPPEGDRPPAAEWYDHPQARHWWTTLTERLGIQVDLTVTRFGGARAFLAELREHPVRAGRPVAVVRTVEATAADAVAFAALTAVARVTAARHGTAVDLLTVPGGAAAPLAAAGVQPTGWTDEGWTDTWLTGLADREPALLDVLHRLTGLHTAPWRPAGPGPHPVADALRGCGFAALATSGGPR